VNQRSKVFLVIATVVIILVCVFAAAFMLRGTNGIGSGDSGVEVEDCDAEDYRNRERECGFIKTSEPKKPAVKTPAPKQPAPRVTRR